VLVMKKLFQSSVIFLAMLINIAGVAQVIDKPYLSPVSANPPVNQLSHPVPVICGSGATDHLRPKPPLASDVVGTRSPNALPVNPYIIVQGIHNVAAKWYGGSVYRYDIGTGTSGAALNNINSGSLLNNYQTNTGGHSYPELQASALAKGTTFNIGQQFYVNLYYTSASTSPDLSLPATFNWTTLGDPSYNVTITVATTYAVGSTSAVPFTPAQAAKLQAFYDLVNPIVKEVYGPPSINHTVTVVNDAFAVGKNVFYNGPDEISSNNINMINSYGDLDQPRLLVHELIHAYRDNVCLSTNSMWHYDPALSGFEEGSAEGVALIVMDLFNARYPNFFNTPDFHRHWNEEGGMPFEWDYDFNNHHQVTTEDFWSSDIATGSGLLRYGLGATAIRKIYIEDPNAIKNFNAEYYKRLNANHTLVPNRSLVVDIFQTVKPVMERTPMAKWIDQQFIFDCKIDQRKKIFMLSYTATWWNGFEHDNRIFFMETHKYGSEWYWQSADQAGANEIPLNAVTNSSWSWTHQLNNIPGDIKFIRDWNNSNYKTRSIINSSHWVTENPNDAVKFNKPLLGPYQGPNPWYIGAALTRDDEQDNCTRVPGCGKRAWAIGNQPLYTTTSSTKAGVLPARVELDMHESGLFRFEISFNDPKGPVNTDSHFRLLGDDFIDMKGLCGGIYSTITDQVDGKLFIEHENFPTAEPAITIKNNSFKSLRTWTAIPATQPQFEMGRNDVNYTTPGKVHAIYVSQDCSKKKMDFRTVGYGGVINGTEMLLFNVEEMEDITFTASADTTLCKGGSFTLKVSNNFTDILNREKDKRIKYTWKGPNNTVVSTDTIFTKNSAVFTDGGIYTLSIEFFGCPAAFTKSIKVTIDTSSAIRLAHPADTTVCVGGSIQLNTTVVSGTAISYAWTGPNNFNQTIKNPVITGAMALHAGQYIVTVTGKGCGGITITAKDTIMVTVNNTGSIQLAHPADTTVCAGGSIHLTANVISGTATVYDWTGPNNFNQTNVQNPVITGATALNAGQYIVTVTGKGCGGVTITAKDTIIVTVNTVASLQLVHPADTTVCAGGTIYLKANAISGTATSYDWTGPNSYNQTNLQNPVIASVTALNAGQYIVTVTGKGCGGATVTAKDTIQVTVNNIGTMQLAHPADITVCAGSTITLTANVVSGTATSYNWTGPNSYQSTTQNPSISNAQSLNAGMYIVTVTGNGCGGIAISAKDTIIVTVNTIGAIQLSHPPDISICEGATISLTATAISGTVTSYNWTGPNAYNQVNVQNPIISNGQVLHSGQYIVIATGKGCGGTTLIARDTIEVTVKPNPVVNLIVPALSPACPGDNVPLTVNAITGATYLWTGPNSFMDTARNAVVPVVSSVKQGTYTITVKVPGCAAGTFVTATATTQLILKTGGTLFAISDQKICEGEQVQLNAVVSGTANAYKWTAPNGTVISLLNTASIPQFIIADTGTYLLQVDFGCKGLNASEKFNLQLQDKNICHPIASYYMPTAFSPNGDGQNDVLYVYGKSIAHVNLSIYDRWGALVFNTNSLSVGWDGTYKGELLNTSVFAYKLNIQFTDGSAEVKESGNVTLIR
jgi:gliding motility-associated-like protein